MENIVRVHRRRGSAAKSRWYGRKAGVGMITGWITLEARLGCGGTERTASYLICHVVGVVSPARPSVLATESEVLSGWVDCLHERPAIPPGTIALPGRVSSQPLAANVGSRSYCQELFVLGRAVAA
jgi:hypothetical protein